MEGRRVLRSLTLKNILSFGPEGQKLDFEPLNVLIGPNGSGKTNLIEVLSLIRALPPPGDLSRFFSEAGGITEWLWKGEGGEPPHFAGMEEPETKTEPETLRSKLRERLKTKPTEPETLRSKVRERLKMKPTEPETLRSKARERLKTKPKEKTEKPNLFIESEWELGTERPLKHALVLGVEAFRPRVISEAIASREEDSGFDQLIYSFSCQFGDPQINVPNGLKTDRSILAQRREPNSPEVDDLQDRFSEIHFYRNWTFGPLSPVRSPQRADRPGDFLEENALNLGLILNGLSLDRRAKETLLENLRRVYEGASDIRVNVVAGHVELFIIEDDRRAIPAVRLSDGTLRYLYLLAILCHPDPPPLICIEEPELGLHPDIIATIARLLIDASQRTQLIVTTHSSDLVSALGDVPEAVVVCERGLDGTTLERLEPKRMQKWLEKYSLGHLWGMGEIGGNRW
jgi:predicted ATPase